MYFKYILACICILNFAHLKYFSKYSSNSKFNAFINGGLISLALFVRVTEQYPLSLALALYTPSSGGSAGLLVLYFVVFSSSWKIADQTVLCVIFVIHLFVMFE